MKTVSTILLCMCLFACSNLTTSQQQLASNLAHVAVDAAGAYFLGPVAGQQASNALWGAASVLQAYVGSTIPASVLKASPGVQGVGAAIVNEVAPNHVVSQKDVATFNKAAQLAQTLQPVLH